MLYSDLWRSPKMSEVRRCFIFTVYGNLSSRNILHAWKVYVVVYNKIGIMKIGAGTERSTCFLIHIIMMSDF